MIAETKSRVGRRTVGLPHPVVEALEEHRVRQAAERERAANLWEEGGWVFANLVGRPIHPSEDHRAWKALLRAADVRDARLHDARYTAATVLLVLKVPLVAVMELMGWSDASVVKRYMHVTDEVVTAVAAQVGGHMWTDHETNQEADETELTDEQRAAIRQVTAALPKMPKHLRSKLEALLLGSDNDGEDGSATVAVPA